MSRSAVAMHASRPRVDKRRSPSELKRQYLSKVEIFQDLTSDQIAQIEQGFRMSPHVPKGRIVFEPDQTGEGLFILKTGEVQIYRISPEGKRFVVGTIGPGTFFGEMAIVGQSMYGSFAETAADSCVCVMSRTDLERLIRHLPQVGLRIMHSMAARLAAAETNLEDLALKSLAARLATFILRETSETRPRMLGLTHNDLAERVGTSRETATQALNELKAEGLIRISRKRIDVSDRTALEDVAEAY